MAGVVMVAWVLSGVVTVACGGSAGGVESAEQERATYDRPMQLEIALELGEEVELGSMQLLVEYDVEQLELHQLTSLLPESMRLEYDAERLGRGRFRLLCVPRHPRAGGGDDSLVRAQVEPLRVARLQLSSRRASVEPRPEWVRITRYSAFGPLPDQPDVTHEITVRLEQVQ